MALLYPLTLAQFTPLLKSYPGGIAVSVNTSYGTVEGRYNRDARVNQFFGIPFGATTGGNNRWQAPQPVTPWSDTYMATESFHCSQMGNFPATVPGDFNLKSVITGVEDCLKLDVITPSGGSPALPAVPPPNTYPVQYWIYGGGFTIESFPIYQYKLNYYAAGDPDNLAYLADNGKLVTVITRYRINYLGFMSHPALRATSNDGYSGNYGMLDAIEGLKWVASEIVNFGGNPDMVTIQGESAGATLTAMLVASPLSYTPAQPKNLFRGAVTQSLWPVAGKGASFSQRMRDEMGDYVIGSVGCGDYNASSITDTGTLTTIAECLRSKTPAEIQAPAGDAVAFNAVHGASAFQMMSFQGLATYPCVDGYALPKSPLELYLDGYGSSVSLIIGQTTDEEAYFLSAVYGTLYEFNLQAGYFYAIWNVDSANSSASISDLNVAANAFAGSTNFEGSGYTNAINGFYSDIVDDYQKLIQWNTDAYFAVNHDVLFDTFSAQPSRSAGTIFHYVYAQPNTGTMDVDPLLGAPHTNELNYVWGYYAMYKNYLLDNYFLTAGEFTYTAKENTMGLSMKKYWASFFVSGTPSDVNDGLPTWSPITSSTDKHTMIFKAGAPGDLGAIQDPCAQFVACITEDTSYFRKSAVGFWRSAFQTTDSLQTCTAPVVGYSHTSTAQYASTCTYNPCCSSRRSRSRSLLFGVPNGGGSGTTNCDSFC